MKLAVFPSESGEWITDNGQRYKIEVFPTRSAIAHGNAFIYQNLSVKECADRLGLKEDANY